jgi:hypothetical protein
VLETELRLSVDGEIRGLLRTPSQRINLQDVTAVYARPYDSRRLPAVRQAGQGSAAWWHALAIDDALWSWAEVTPALVINRPAAATSNSSKPYQAGIIGRHGFAVPETLITTDPAAARAFWERHRQVIYKSVSGVRSQVMRLHADSVSRLADVVWCPTQFQQYVPGREHRVHVVGDQVFTCEIIADADDYRYAAPGAVELRPCHLPPDIMARCRRLAAAMGLSVAGIDLRRDPRGEWYCFEINPSPAFTYFEDAASRPITAAVASLLAGGAAPPASAPPESMPAESTGARKEETHT